MTEDYDPEQINELLTLIDAARGAAGIEAPERQQNMAEAFNDYISGKGEVPGSLEKDFFQILAPSIALMPLETRADVQMWRMLVSESLTLYDICHPHKRLSIYERHQIELRAYNKIQRGTMGGFEREKTIANMSIIRTQQEAVRAPVQGTAKRSVGDKLKSLVRGN